MNDTLHTEIPSLDLADFTSGDPARKARFVKDLGNAFNTIGFVAIRNHYLTEGISGNLYDVFQRFFFLPEAQKKSTNSRTARAARLHRPQQGNGQGL
jgi:isopenicillin N synthase-like dioxygenase